MKNFWMWLAWRLPRRLVYMAVIRAWAHATQGPWSGDIVTEVRVGTALNRWDCRG